MRIQRDKTVVEFVPENDAEQMALSTLWDVLIDCVKFSRKLVPIGRYTPGESDAAQFMIEGDVDFVPVVVERDTRVYCATCNKYFDVKAGQEIPLCCGRVMEVMD